MIQIDVEVFQLTEIADRQLDLKPAILSAAPVIR
jgi:hypothetical protein